MSGGGGKLIGNPAGLVREKQILPRELVLTKYVVNVSGRELRLSFLCKFWVSFMAN